MQPSCYAPRSWLTASLSTSTYVNFSNIIVRPGGICVTQILVNIHSTEDSYLTYLRLVDLLTAQSCSDIYIYMSGKTFVMLMRFFLKTHINSVVYIVTVVILICWNYSRPTALYICDTIRYILCTPKSRQLTVTSTSLVHHTWLETYRNTRRSLIRQRVADKSLVIPPRLNIGKSVAGQLGWFLLFLGGGHLGW